jgi:non-homologous end joining protein Ku
MVRPIWSGAISFGLVSVPVRMFPATESKELRFHFLHKQDLTPIAYAVDLMAALRESVERTKKQRKGTSKRKAS